MREVQKLGEHCEMRPRGEIVQGRDHFSDIGRCRRRIDCFGTRRPVGLFAIRPGEIAFAHDLPRGCRRSRIFCKHLSDLRKFTVAAHR